LDTMKPVNEIKANPLNKHVGSSGFGAIMEHCGDEMLKASAYLAETLMDPIMSVGDGPQFAPLTLAFNTKKPIFDWFEEPGNEMRLIRFTAAMKGVASADPPDAILRGFQWSTLSPKSSVVDIGGGLGHLTMKIYNAHPHLKYIVQDREQVISQAVEHWKTACPKAIEDDSITLQGHDFFSPQPVKNAAVFMCRMIMHDYGKTYATKILKHLREAATPNTKLLIIDQIVPYACKVEDDYRNIIGSEGPVHPKPLLPNLGEANSVAYFGDLQMLISVNGEERTLGSFVELCLQSGWKITEIYTIPGSIHKQILAIPI